MEPLFHALHRHHELIAVLDFGSQYSHLIARRLREEGIYSELLPYSVSVEALRALQPRGVILSGGPASVYAEGAPHVQRQLFELPVPMLGICYGLQEMAYQLGGSVEAGTKMEFGRAQMRLLSSVQSDHMCRQVWEGVPDVFSVWMSHGDAMTRLPPGFVDLAATDNCPHAVVAYAPTANGTADAAGASTLPPAALRIGLQFHPEVTHTEHGARILANFCRHLCGCRGDWSMEAYVAEAMQAVQQQVGVSGVVVAAGCHRSGTEAQGDWPHLYRGVRCGGAPRAGAVSATGHAVPGCDRVGVAQGPQRHHQDPSQCGRTAGSDAAAADRAAALSVQRRGAPTGARIGRACRKRRPTSVSGPGAGHPHSGRRNAAPPGGVARGRRHLFGGVACGRSVSLRRTGVCGVVAVQGGGRHGRLPHLRRGDRITRGGDHRLHDRRLVPHPVRCAEAHGQPHRERGARREPRGVRYHQQAARHHRVGMRW
eukprot:ctg_227.g123